MEIDFAGKVALVTGASPGIGREIAPKSSESGADSPRVEVWDSYGHRHR